LRADQRRPLTKNVGVVETPSPRFGQVALDDGA